MKIGIILYSYSGNILSVPSIFRKLGWAVSIILGGIASIAFSLLMRKSKVFRGATAWAMMFVKTYQQVRK